MGLAGALLQARFNTPMGEVIFNFPEDCLSGVGEVFSGLYDPPINVTGPVKVLDIGANCGAFTIWALRRWPQCTVTAYEPLPSIFRILDRNTRPFSARVTCVEAAVGDLAVPYLLVGADTRLCSSQYDIGRQSEEHCPVEVIPAAELPKADIIKIDTEGAEGFIVETLPYWPSVLMVEYHSELLRTRVEVAVRHKMTLVRHRMDGIGWGHAHYVRDDLSKG